MSEDSTQCTVIFNPRERRVLVPRGTTIWEAAQLLGIMIEAECGGRGACGKCVVKAGPGASLSPPDEQELNFLSSEDLKEGRRLACRCKVIGDVEVELEEEPIGAQEVPWKRHSMDQFKATPLVRRIAIGDADPLRGLDEAEDLVGVVQVHLAKIGLEPTIPWDLNALRGLSVPGDERGGLTLILHATRGVTGIRRGRRLRSLGLALDIGTTTLACYLCDISAGRVLTQTSALNPQRAYGHDVISRIDYVNRTQGGLEKLHKEVINAVSLMTRRCLRRAGATQNDVDEVVAVGNTTMLHLFCGLHPNSLGYAPYRPVTRSALDLRAGDLGLDLDPGTNVHLLPVISGFVGADTVGGILSQDIHRATETVVLVDIGTNGEIVLASQEGIWATSCAMGPALEGAHLSCGMRAVRGAIWKVWEEEGKLGFQVVGRPDEKPRGVCGSGVVDALATLLRLGILLPTGRFREGAKGVCVDSHGVGRAFVLAEGDQTAHGRPISITLEDVRQVQLAKAALCVGIRTLLRRSNTNRVDKLILTGAFGAHFNWRSASEIGMIPKELMPKEVEAVENAAGVGAILALLDSSKRAEALEVAQKVRAVELAQEPEFAIEYAMAMNFPTQEAD